MSVRLPHPGLRAFLLAACCLALLAFAPPAAAQEPAPEPPVTVPSDPGPSPNPDPAPDPPAPAPSPPVVSSPPVYVPPSQPADTGPTPAEIREQRRQERIEAQQKAAAEKAAREAEEQRQLEILRTQAAEAREQGLDAFDDATNNAPAIAVPSLPAAAAQEGEQAPETLPPILESEALPAAANVTADLPQAVAESSPLTNAAPVLLGLLGLSILLLGAAALPPWTVRSTALAGLLAHRRLEIGLVGTAVLASAAIGLAIAISAG
jgi:hypothetical protein